MTTPNNFPNNTAELQAMIAKLTAENVALTRKASAKKSHGASIRVSAKGGVSVYGLGRFPVTLYKSQWVKLLSMAQDINAFLEANESALAVRAEKVSEGDVE
jgi:hypothetical protein